ncbi:MAG TPA: aldose epimerase family protein [Verrucomicrobiae bacterium]|nr:aldose epimerase family protein [Verrucomicrobiae bacterium]
MKKIIQSIMLTAAGLCVAGLVGCASMSKTGVVKKAPFGKIPDGAPVEIYTLRNYAGMEARIMTYGGTVVSLKVPDKNGKLGDVVLGFDNLAEYRTNSPYFGALIGRYGNRIAKGKFSLDGHEYTLAVNNGSNSLHGGLKGFDKVVWKAEPVNTAYGPGLQLTYLSKDGEEGYPGNLSVTADYVVTENNELIVQFTAKTDQDTVCNLTHHSYFNLSGKGDVLDDVVQIDADKFTPTDSTQIPTGELRPVAGTPFDFRQPMPIGARIKDDNEQLKIAEGYDHNFVLNKMPGEFGRAATVYDPASGREMEVWTTAPGVQFYTGNFLDGTIKGKGGHIYHQYDAFCFEPQGFPDSPNHPKFPSTELKPGEIYKNTIIYKFSARRKEPELHP